METKLEEAKLFVLGPEARCYVKQLLMAEMEAYNPLPIFRREEES